MSSSSRTTSGRRSRPRRRPAPTADRRLPVGSIRTQRDPDSTSHIQIIPHPEDSDSVGSPDYEQGDIPVHTNPSYLVEVECVSDSNSTPHQRQTSGHTFADMARAGVGRDAADFMASSEPQSLSNYYKFTKPNRGKTGGRWKQVDSNEDEEPMRPSSSFTDYIEPDEHPLNFIGNRMGGEHGMDQRCASDPSQALQNTASVTAHPIDPITALGEHMDAVRKIFGFPLPGPTYIKATEGKRDGEVVCIIHPNGDIGAHQWGLHKFEWNNIGQYSYSRKQVEGTLGHEQLKGQKIGSSMPRNTLEYFVAIAKQYEETSIAKASEVTGYERGSVQNRVRPALPLPMQPQQRPAPTVDTSGETSRSFSSAGYPSQRTGLPTLSIFQRHSASRRESLEPTEDRFSNLNIGARETSRFSSPVSADISPLTRRKSASPELKRMFAPNPRNNIALAQSGLLRYPDSLSTPIDSPSSHFSIQKPRDEPVDDYQVTRKKIFQQEEQRMQQKMSAFHVRQVIDEDSDGEETPPRNQSGLKDTALRKFLEAQTVSPTLSTRPQSHKPQADEMAFHSVLNKDNASVLEQPKIFQYPRPAAATTVNPPTSSGSLAPRATLKQSEAEADCHSRQVPILSKEHTADMSNEELMLYCKPTPQDWNGPFFTDDKPFTAPINPMSDDKTFMQWWTSGTKSDRQEDYLRVQERTRFGPIGSRKAFVNGIERPLLAVRENLQAYVEGPNTRDYFSKFTAPPDYCINDSPKGRQSFFGEDYGPPPPRVGRDPRYRHSGARSSFGFDDPLHMRRQEVRYPRGGLLSSFALGASTVMRA